MNKSDIDVIGVALTKRICPICRKEMDGEIVMNKRLTKGEAAKVNALNGQVVGFSENACDECAKLKDEAAYIVAIDEEHSNEERVTFTGPYFGVNKECEFVTRNSKYFNTTKNGVMYTYMPDTLCEQLGLIANIEE